GLDRRLFAGREAKVSPLEPGVAWREGYLDALYQEAICQTGGRMDASSHIDRRSAGQTRGAAMTFVVLLGLVSLFADMTYEGARSITGPYLAVLGASATVVGIVAGFGELIGYMLRLVAGYLSDRTGRYWTFTLVGYVVNLLAVPFLALAGRCE